MSLIVWKNLKILSVVFYCWSFWNYLKACNYPLHHYDISLINFWSPNKQLKYMGKWGKIFINSDFSSGKGTESMTKRIPLNESFYMRFLHQESKLPVCVTRKRYPEKENVQITIFSLIFISGIWITKKHFSFILKPTSE